MEMRKCDCNGSGKLCRDCVDYAIANHPQIWGRKNIAKIARRRYFPWDCETCGLGMPHVTKTMKCATCDPEPDKDAPRERGARAEARRSGVPTYTHTCDRHGVTLFGTQSGKCLRCFNTAGIRRPPKFTRLQYDMICGLLLHVGFVDEEIEAILSGRAQWEEVVTSPPGIQVRPEYARQTELLALLERSGHVKRTKLHEPTGRHYLTVPGATCYLRGEYLSCSGDAPALRAWAAAHGVMSEASTPDQWIARLTVDTSVN